MRGGTFGAHGITTVETKKYLNNYFLYILHWTDIFFVPPAGKQHRWMYPSPAQEGFKIITKCTGLNVKSGMPNFYLAL